MNANAPSSAEIQVADMDQFKKIIARVAAGERLDITDARLAFDIMMTGNATPAQIGGFLMGLRVRGETVEEITGGALALRARVHSVKAPLDCIDTCGTGGDASSSWNISTAVSFVLAGLGITVAKHGNKAQSSKSGAADVLAALGVKIDCDFSLVEQALREAKIGFLMAPRHHGAMRHVGPARVELGTRTIFNLLGPLSNPAGARRQLLGVFNRQWVRPMAEVLRNLGSEKVWVVHGSDGMDELTTTGPSYVAALENGQIREFEIHPEELGLPVAPAEALKGGDANQNAHALMALLEGQQGPYYDIVLLNSAAAILISDKAQNLAEAVILARDALLSGKAKAALTSLIQITNRPV